MDKMELRRPQQAAPTEVGWHYGRLAYLGPAAGVQPQLVLRYSTDDPEFCVEFHGGIKSARDFVWFGPVPVCIKATVPADG